MAFKTRKTNIPSNVLAAVAAANGAGGDPMSLYDVEQSMMLDPIGTIGRIFPVYLLGATFSSNVATFTPQRPVIPLRLCVPKAQGVAGAIVQTLQIALEPVYTRTAAEPANNYGEDTLETSWLPPMLCDYGQSVTFQGNSNNTSAGLWVADISKPKIDLNGPLFRVPFNGLAITHGTTATLTVDTQKKFKLRRIVFDIEGQGATNGPALAACTTNSINCGVSPQLESSAKVPIAMFDSRGLFGYQDGDTVTPGQSFTMAIANGDGAIDLSNVSGVLLGDLVP